MGANGAFISVAKMKLTKNNKLSVFLVEDEQICIDQFQKHAKKREGFIVSGISDSARVAEKIIYQKKPSVLLVDLQLSEGNGIELISRVRQERNYNPYIVAITQIASQHTLRMLHDSLTDFVFLKTVRDFSYSQVFDFLEIMKRNIIDTSDETAEIYIKKLLDKYTIHRNIAGKNHLAEAILLKLRSKKKKIVFSKDIFPVIGEKYGKVWYNIEKSCRNAIAEAFMQTPWDVLVKEYTALIDPSRGVPTTSEFINYYVEKLKH
ncbi:sporulation initiation factor Spo0A C-terminal domain-containing protein [Treponema sp. R6D11]